MNVHHLELFYYVAKHGGISAAVRKIPYGIQQPAISGQMTKLEQDLGVRLFERSATICQIMLIGLPFFAAKLMFIQALNAFDRQMCEEIRSAWRRIKADASVNAVVLRAAGERAFCAGLDVKKDYGQPDDVWNHEDPGELLSPKWQKLWKPVVCAVQGMCTAGAFYFLNEADIVICSPVGSTTTERGSMNAGMSRCWR